MFAQSAVAVKEVYAALTARFDKITREYAPAQFVGLQLRHSESGLEVHQERYTQRLIDEFPECPSHPTPATAAGIPPDGDARFVPVW